MTATLTPYTNPPSRRPIARRVMKDAGQPYTVRDLHP
jgi:hypothetical protein